MTTTPEAEKKVAGHTPEFWTKVVGGIGGALILGLQGINLTETTGQTSLMHRIDVAIEQQSTLIREVNKEGIRVDTALENQEKMLQTLDSVLHNQGTTLDILKEEKKEP
jgi:hypothetical protein